MRNAPKPEPISLSIWIDAKPDCTPSRSGSTSATVDRRERVRPALEARAHGTRVAVADAGALPEVVGDGALLPVADAAAWAEVMADDRSEAADVIKRRSAAAAACSWSRASRQWLDALRAISSSRS